jgi:chemotaxis-related protein WspD
MSDTPSAGTQPGPPSVSPGEGDCWNRIGTSGDGSCPELQRHIHCRNCPVFASAARAFFDRPAPGDYLAEWTQWLARSEEPGGQDAGDELAAGERDRVGVLIFRLGNEWLAFRTQTIAEVTLPRPVHRIPHRSTDVLIGLVNLRGQLQLCISLSGLLGVESAQGPLLSSLAHVRSEGKGLESEAGTHAGIGAGVAATPGARLVVLRDRDRSETWVFPAEEVLGVHRLARGQVRSVSSALANPEVSFSQAILSWRDRSIGFLDEQRVFAALRSIGQ